MKRFFIGFLFLVAVSIPQRAIYSEQLSNRNDYQTITVAQDSGNSIRAFSVNVGTATSVLIYSSTQSIAARNSNYDSPDRLLVIQNIQPFKLYCSSSSTVSATAGPRFEIFESTAGSKSVFTTFSVSPIWCIYEAPAGAAKEIIGYVESDTRD